MSICTVYVVNWSPEDGVGGFEWNVDRAEAERFRRELADWTAELHVVKVPDDLARRADAWALTEWLDAEGWSDGGDPRRTIVRR